MVEYLSGNRIQGSSTLSSAPPATSWKELARASLSGAGDTITTSTFTAKDNMKVLTFGLASGNIEAALQVGNGSIDTNHTASGNEFITYDILNVANQEKLVVADLVDSNSAGAGNAPNRVEHVGKWANTSNQINIVQAKNVGGGSFDTGSEIIVLGCDNDEADSGTNFWQELDSVELSATANEINSGTFTAKKYLWVQLHGVASGSISGADLQFNGDTGSNYARRYSANGGSDGTGTSEATLGGIGTASGDSFVNWFIINKSDKEKLVVGEGLANTTGAGNAPDRRELTGKWANTSAQITSIKVKENGSGGWTNGTTLKVWGSD